MGVSDFIGTAENQPQADMFGGIFRMQHPALFCQVVVPAVIPDSEDQPVLHQHTVLPSHLAPGSVQADDSNPVDVRPAPIPEGSVCVCDGQDFSAAFRDGRSGSCAENKRNKSGS